MFSSISRSQFTADKRVIIIRYANGLRDKRMRIVSKLDHKVLKSTDKKFAIFHLISILLALNLIGR